MPLSKQLRDYVASECTTAAQKMKSTDSPVEQLYYFSASWAAPQRAFNIEFDAKMLHLHVVLNWAYQQLVQSSTPQIASSTPGQPTVDALRRLPPILEELATRVGAGKNFDDVMDQIAVAGYSAGGNGHYLEEIGRLTH